MSEIVNWKGVRYYADTGAIENLTAENDKLRARLARLEEALRRIVSVRSDDDWGGPSTCDCDTLGRKEEDWCVIKIARAALAEEGK